MPYQIGRVFFLCPRIYLTGLTLMELTGFVIHMLTGFLAEPTPTAYPVNKILDRLI